MVEARLPYRGLVLLGRAFRDQAIGVLSIGRGATALRLVLRQGHIAAVVFPDDQPKAPLPPPGPEDSAQLRLERVLTEIGIRTPSPRGTRRARNNLREQMLAGLLDTDAAAVFEEGGLPENAVEVAGATEPLILEAIRRVPDPQTVRDGLGNLEQRLVATAGLAEERTLTLTEGYILSRVDGQTTAREVLQLVPLEPEETERTLLGLLLTGRLEYRPAPPVAQPAPAAEWPGAPAPDVAAGEDSHSSEEGRAASADGEAEASPAEPVVVARVAEPAATTEAPTSSVTPSSTAPSMPAAESTESAPSPEASPTTEPAPADEPAAVPLAAAGVPATPAAHEPAPGAAASTRPSSVVDEPARPEADPAVLARRREVLEFFQSLPTKNHFEVLGVEPGCTDAAVKRAYATLARRYHPDTTRRTGLEDLHDVLEGIFIRIGEAWEVLGDKRSRANYEARSGVRRRPVAGAPAGASDPPSAPSGRAPAEPEPYVPSDETLIQAQLFLAQARYWDAIQMLEQRLPQMPPSKQQRRGRILLARAYAKNPNWLRKAEDALQQVVREDPQNADAHYELGLLYKAGGMVARAHASFRRALELRPDHREAAAELGLAPEAAGSRSQGGLLKRLFGRGRAS